MGEYWKKFGTRAFTYGLLTGALMGVIAFLVTLFIIFKGGMFA